MAEETDKEKIARLEKRVKTLETINYIRLGIAVFTFFGVTALIVEGLKGK